MFKMITKTDHPYGGRDLKPGDEFDAESQQHVDILTALGRAELKREPGQVQGHIGKNQRRARGAAV